MFAIVDATSGCIVDCNPALSIVTGFSKHELTGRHVFDLCEPTFVRRARAVSRDVVRTGTTLGFEGPLQTKTRGTVPVSVSVAVGSRTADGRVVECLVILHDMTRRKTAEAALQASEARYQDLYHNAPDMLASLDRMSSRIVQCNNTLARVCQRDRGDLIGCRLVELLTDESRPVARHAFDDVAETGAVRNVHLQLLRGEGRSPLDVSMHVTTVRRRAEACVSPTCPSRYYRTKASARRPPSSAQRARTACADTDR